MALYEIVSPLVAWYHQHKRSLPWRDFPTPYRVWVSEIMLQQTRVDPAIPYFERFVSTLPDIRALAETDEKTLLKLWEGLGYYSRVRNLQKAAKIVQSEFDGVLPNGPKALLTLPGIGEYTAGAIASIAYQVPVPAVDGNVLRVISRITADESDIALPETKRAMQKELQGIIPQERPGDFNQALMDLGATVCLPNGAPHCDVCPLSALCEAYKQKRTEEIPKKTKKQAPVTEEMTVFLVVCDGRVALLKRPESGLLAGLWEFPNLPGRVTTKSAADALKQLGLTATKTAALPKAKHVFTHKIWKMNGIFALTDTPAEPFTWVTAEELLDTYTLPTAFRAYQNEALLLLKE